MEENQIKIKTLSNMIWRFTERCGAQGVAFVVSIVLARLLTPTEYGTVALITVFTTIFQVFVDSGMGNALIQKKNADQLDFSSVFYFNIVMCVVVYAILFAIAPLIASFYDDPSLTPMVRVVGLTIIIAGLKNIQQAYVSKHLLFRKFFFSTLGGTIVAGVVGIAMAYLGFGAWAIVAQQVINVFIDTCILYITVRWRPTKQFSLKRLKQLFGFGWKLLASSLLDTVYNNLRSLIIGKLYSSDDLAYYNKGKQIPNLFITNINNSIDSVLFPVMSQEQNDVTRIKSMLRRSIKTSVYILAPLMMGIAFVAEPLIRLLLTEKWLSCVFFLRIFCITYMFYPIHTANLNAIKAMGRSDLFLKLEILKKIVGMAAVLISMWFGVKAMALSLLVTSLLSQLINSWPNRRLLDYGYLSQLKDILPGILLAVFMGDCVFPITLLDLPDILTLVIQVILGAAIYIGGSRLLKLEEFYYVLDMIKSMMKKRQKKADFETRND
ncbi:MAG: lipopolysaccharide biosynthesis protein [Ruminococcus sp.]|nr:lipopolysaccharide biosynthesis protein [Ruminococcus sp.]